MKNKKGGLPDGIFLVIAFFVLAVIFLFSYVIFSKINNEFQESSLISDQGKSMSSTTMGRFPGLFDNIFLFIVVGFGIAIIAGVWFIPSHPALFWLSIPVLAFIIWLGALYSNIYYQIRTHELVASFASDFPITIFIFDNFVLLITMYMILLAVALYGKARVDR